MERGAIDARQRVTHPFLAPPPARRVIIVRFVVFGQVFLLALVVRFVKVLVVPFRELLSLDVAHLEELLLLLRPLDVESRVFPRPSTPKHVVLVLFFVRFRCLLSDAPACPTSSRPAKPAIRLGRRVRIVALCRDLVALA